MYRKVMGIVFLLLAVQLSFATPRYPRKIKLQAQVLKAMERAGGMEAIIERLTQQQNYLEALPKASEGTETLKKALHWSATTYPDGFFHLGNFLRDASTWAYVDEEAIDFLKESHQKAKGTFVEPVLERVIARASLRHGKMEELAEFMQSEGVNWASLRAEDLKGLTYSEYDTNSQFWKDIDRLARDIYGEKWASAYQLPNPLRARDIIAEKFSEDERLLKNPDRALWLQPWVKGRGPLAGSVADSSLEATFLWLKKEQGKPEIFTKKDLIEYSHQLLLDEDLHAIVENKEFFELTQEEFSRMARDVDNDPGLHERYDVLMEQAGSFLRANEKYFLHLYRDPYHPIHSEQCEEVWDRASSLQLEIATFQKEHFPVLVPAAILNVQRALDKALVFWRAGTVIGE